MKWIAKILTLLGVGVVCTACYGTGDAKFRPYKDGSVMGKVVDSEGKPVNNIKVSVGNSSSNDIGHTFTGTDGYYEVHYRLDTDATSVLLEFDDIDGAENGGEFASTTASVGEGSNEVPTIVMTLKE